jgi:hypothetical protein
VRYDEVAIGLDSKLQHVIIARIFQVRSPQEEDLSTVANPTHIVENVVNIVDGQSEIPGKSLARVLVLENERDRDVDLESCAPK